MRRPLRPSHPAIRLVALLAVLALAHGCGSGSRAPDPAPGYYKIGQPYQINGRWYHPAYDPDYRAVGIASWYGAKFHGRPTANGERYDRHRITAAHPTLPLPSIVRVTNLENGRELVVRVNDRGPFVGERVIDLSQAAARELGFERQGLARVEVEFLEIAGDALGDRPEPPVQVATAAPRQPAPASPPPRPPRAEPVRAEPVRAEPVRLAEARAEPAVLTRPESCAGAAWIQVAALSDPSRVGSLTRELQAHLPVRIAPSMVGGQAVARVQAGPFPGPADLQAALERLHALGHTEAFPVAEQRLAAGELSSVTVAC
jgi:rare lipoprotein A